jgi:hypothetical protein
MDKSFVRANFTAMKWDLNIAYPLWLIVASLGLGILYAWVFYFYDSKNTTSLNVRVRNILAFCRFLLVALLSFLLLEPVVKYISYVQQKPTLVVLIDDSESMTALRDSAQHVAERLYNLEKKIADDYQVDYLPFDESLKFSNTKALNFKGDESCIGGVLREVKSQYFNQNLAGVILLTDGINNAGLNPQNVADNYNVPIYTIGFGDTNRYADLSVQDVICNSMAYLGSEFTCAVELKADKLKGENASVQISMNGNEVERKKIFLSTDQFYKEIDFDLDAIKVGTNRIDVKLTVFDEEKNTKNNFFTFYIDVIDGKRKVQIWSEMPHPDIGMLRSSIASNMNYDVAVKMNRFTVDGQLDLVILYNWFSDQSKLDLFENIKAKGIPVLCVAGDRFKPNYFNAGSQNIKFKSMGNSMNSTLPVLNTEFNYFKFKEEAQYINKFPPLVSPYGVWKGFSLNDVFLYQKIGNVKTKDPLWIMHNEDGYRYGIISGLGIWQWKLTDYEQNENHDVSKLIINKVLQYLTVKENKKLLRVQPSGSEFETKETIVLQGELYNQGLEFVKGQEINILLKDDQNKEYQYTMTEKGVNYSLELSNLHSGAYSYVASTLVGSQKLSDYGSFVVLDIQKELMNQTANFDVLRKIAYKTKGRFYQPGWMDSLARDLTINKLGKTKILDQHKYADLIYFKSLFWLIVLILSMEWFVRKWAGGY